MKKLTHQYPRDVDECAEKIKALLTEYNSHIEIIDDNVCLVDDDTLDFSVIHEDVL